MSKPKSKSELVKHKDDSVSIINKYLDSLINSTEPKQQSKADKLSYWLKDWTAFLEYETSFEPTHLRRYKRGEIVKVHLGFNVGSEEGGLHYAVVLDKNNPKSSAVVTVIPLTSVKPGIDVNNLKSGRIFLGNEIFTKVNSKISTLIKQINEQKTFLTSLDDNMPTDVAERIKKLIDDLKLLQRMKSEIQRMKVGSIALVNQVTTISKIRIYDPKTDSDVLSNVRLSDEKLDLIDKELISTFTGFKHKTIDNNIK